MKRVIDKCILTVLLVTQNNIADIRFCVLPSLFIHPIHRLRQQKFDEF